jgi:hypothetical protein
MAGAPMLALVFVGVAYAAVALLWLWCDGYW